MRQSSLVLSITLTLCFFIPTSCKKKESKIGYGLLQKDDYLNTAEVDTFQLVTYTKVQDSVVSSRSVHALLGNYNDPKFGSFQANFYTQLLLSGFNPNFGNTSQLVVDSVILSLKYKGYYGDLSPQTLEVFEMLESIDTSETYFSFNTKLTSAENLVTPGFETFTPNPNGKTIVGNDTVAPQLRIKLKNSFGIKLINDASAGGTQFSSHQNFLNYLKGLHVRVKNTLQNSGSGGVFYFDIMSPDSKLTLYYKLFGETKMFDLLINRDCAKFNHVSIDNNGSPAGNVLANSNLGQKEFYAQSFSAAAIIKIPSVKKIPINSTILKASLFLPVQHQTGGKYPIPANLSVGINLNGKLIPLPGASNAATYQPSSKQYKIDVRGFVQDLNSGLLQTDELFIFPNSFNSSADRLIFNGPISNNKHKPKLVVTYTTF